MVFESAVIVCSILLRKLKNIEDNYYFDETFVTKLSIAKRGGGVY